MAQTKQHQFLNLPSDQTPSDMQQRRNQGVFLVQYLLKEPPKTKQKEENMSQKKKKVTHDKS